MIRLQRTGKKNQADFRIVLAEKTAAAQKKIVELLGSYNPHKKFFKVAEDRVKYWISQHTGMSTTIHNLFVDKGLLEGKKIKAFNVPKKPSPAEAVVGKKEEVKEAASAVPETKPDVPAAEAPQA